MIYISYVLSSILVLSVNKLAASFSPNEMKLRNTNTRRRPFSSSRRNILSIKVAGGDSSDMLDTIFNAQECAMDETCTVEYADIYLQELSQIQADGTLALSTSSDNVCISDIILMLRKKINNGIALEDVEEEDISHIVFASIFAFSIAAIVFSNEASTTTNSAIDIFGSVSFTPQEVLWAMQGGYLDDMFVHFLRNGGL